MSISVLLDMAASGFGERTAVSSPTESISFAELRRRALGGASVVANRSPRHVAFVGRNGPAYVQAMFAAALAGVPFVPLNYRLSRRGLHELLSELAGTLVIADAGYLDLFVDSNLNVLPTADFTELARTSDPSELPPTEDDSPAILLYTSGTTAKAKAVVLRHEHLASYVFATVEFGSASLEEASLISVPPYHVAAVAATLTNLFRGRRVVYLPNFEPRAWLDAVRTERVTSAMVVPTMLARIIDETCDGPVDLPALQLISYGGSRMPRSVIERALRVFPSVDFVNAYGLTETSSTIALLGPADHREALESADERVRARLSSVGRPLPGVEVQIRDEGGTSVAPGDLGLLWVRGSQVSGEYLSAESALDEDGWFPTRDLARLDRNGYLFVEGRADDTIIRGGENIAPAEIEDVLISHPAVAEVAVVGIPDDQWGQRICAVVVPRSGAAVTAGELISFVRGRLRGSRTPDAIVWRERLPHSAIGKLLRRQLTADIAKEF
jgi:acyl-CoA synthetase (AMP-forming)/AMP-acid ligase II